MSDQESIVAQCTLYKSDLIRFWTWQYLHSGINRFLHPAEILLGMFFFLRPSPSGAVLPRVGGLLLALYPPVKALWGLGQYYFEPVGPEDEDVVRIGITFSFSSQGVTWSNSSTSEAYMWSDLKDVVYRRTALYLMFAGGPLLIPLRAFETDADLKGACVMIESHLAERGV